MAVFQAPPTYALPILVDEKTGKSTFNPIWLRWFLDLVQGLSPAGAGSGTVTSVNVTGGNGIGVSGSPITGTGTIGLTLGAISPSSLSTGAGTFASAVIAASVTASGALTGNSLQINVGNGVIANGNLTVSVGNLVVSAGNVILSAGNLSMVAGGITTLGGAVFHRTSSNLTNGAAAATGTLTNAPSVGNPTKWIGIDDNGTTRYIPAW